MTLLSVETNSPCLHDLSVLVRQSASSKANSKTFCDVFHFIIYDFVPMNSFFIKLIQDPWVSFRSILSFFLHSLLHVIVKC